MKVIRGRIYTTGNGIQVRVYDGAVDLGNGKYLGIEVKPTDAYKVEPAQRAFDSWVQLGNVAKGYGAASGFDIIGVLPVVVVP